MGCGASTVKPKDKSEPAAAPVKAQQPGNESDPEAEYDAAVLRAKTAALPENSTWRKYGGHELEPLFESTYVIDIRWLLRFANGDVSLAGQTKTSYPSPQSVPAWQDVPADGIVPLEVLRSAQMDYNALPIVVLSYGWASVFHPDPSGEQLARLRPVLQSIVNWCDATGGLCSTWGVVWDFMSFPQYGRTTGYDESTDDRTPEQRALFTRGLGGINRKRASLAHTALAHTALAHRSCTHRTGRLGMTYLMLRPLHLTLSGWYGHPFTTTMVLDVPMPESALNIHPYESRGCAYSGFHRIP